MLRKYIELRIDQYKEMEKYNGIIGEISLIDKMYDSYKLMEEMLGIDENSEEIIDSFVWEGYCDIIEDDGNEYRVETIDEVVRVVKANISEEQDNLLFEISEDIIV